MGRIIHSVFSLLLAGMIVSSCSNDKAILANSDPVILSLKAERYVLRVLDTTAVECIASDPDGDEISYQWSSIDGSILGSGSHIKWLAPSNGASYRLFCEASDANGGMDEASIQLSVIGFDTLSYEDLDKHTHNFLEVREPQVRVFQTATKWNSFWYENVNCITQEGEPCPPPIIDYDDSQVVGVFWGFASSGCSQKRRSVKSIHIANDTIFAHIEYNFDRVFEGCDAEIFPNHLVKLDKHELPIRFTGRYPGCCN